MSACGSRVLGLVAFAMLCLAGGQALSADHDPVKDALSHIEQRASQTHSDALLVIYDGHTLLERYSTEKPQPIELMSATKSVVALIVGRLLTKGMIRSIDQPVSDWYPEWKQGRKQAITLRMLMDHSSGLQNVSDTGVEIYPSKDFVQLALTAELSGDPGRDFSYNNKAVNLIAGIVAKASRQSMDTFANAELFTPLGILPPVWSKDAAGNPHAMSGLSLDARELAKLGQLVLQRGHWNGKQIIDSEFIELMLAAGKSSPEVGLLWWRRPAWVHFRIDDRTFDLLKSRDIEPTLIAALEPLKGRQFDDPATLSTALSRVLGKDWQVRWAQQVVARSGIGPFRAFNAEQGPITAFEANGYLGQYLVVIPNSNLIAVRQIAESIVFQPEDEFDDFTQSVLALAAALGDKHRDSKAH